MKFWKRAPSAVSADAIHSTAGKPKTVSRAIIPIFFVLVIAGAFGTAAYFYYEYRKIATQQPKGDETESVIAEVSKIFELPSGETPTLATVTDREKLSEQEFFSRAENGDKVLLYEGAQKAILFRPSTGKVINVAPINVTGNQEAPASSDPVQSADSESVAGVETSTDVSAGESTPKEAVVGLARVSLLNGSSVTGVTHKVEQEIVSVLSEKVAVVAKEKAVKSDYRGILVVDLSGSRSVEASMIADALKGSVGVLPDGEVAPDGTDVLIIVGNAE